jgi:hypothetical protein
VRGGEFVMLANKDESKYTYYDRGISVQRSNVTIDGLKHFVDGEGDRGAPYHGFLFISRCVDVTIKNCILTGHKTYSTIGAAGKSVHMGSYDISVSVAINVLFENCTQSNDITNEKTWGIMGSNFCKNLSFKNCSLSRFDAHMGVMNASIIHCELGQCVNVIGFGELLIEDTVIHHRFLVHLRGDYGSTWHGNFKIHNCTLIPRKGDVEEIFLFSGKNDGTHNFGYPCYLPDKIEIDGLVIKDKDFQSGYNKAYWLIDFERDRNKESEKKYPYVSNSVIIAKNIRTESKTSLKKCPNEELFADVTVFEKE